MKLAVSALAAAALFAASPSHAQMPSPKEMEAAMRQMQRELDKLTPEQRRMIERTLQQMPSEAAPGAEDDEIGVPRRDAKRIARLPREPLTGAQLKAHVESLQPKLRSALSRDALRRAELVEDVQRKAGGDLTVRLRTASNALAAWGAWPEATYLMGKVALASGSAQDLNNLAAFLTMQKASHAALPILVTLAARYPANSTILNNLGQAWFELGEVKEAERALVLAVKGAPSHPQANVTKSRIEEARGDRPAAQTSMRAAIRGGYSEAKEQRLRKLGGKLVAGDARWKLDKAAHPLGLSDLAPPAYPSNAGETVNAALLWKAHRQRLDETAAQLRAKAARAATERARTALSPLHSGMRLPVAAQSTTEMLRLHAPLAPLAAQVMRDDQATRKAEEQRVTAALIEAERLESAERAKLEQRIRGLHTEGEQRYRNVSGGYQLEYSCKEVIAAQTAYLQKAVPTLERAAQEFIRFEHRRIGELANLYQHSVTEAEFDAAADNFRLQFLQAVARAHNVVGQGKPGFFGAGMVYPYEQICLLRPAAKPPKHKLVDFDEMNCQHVVTFAAPGIGRFDIRCNIASVALDPFALPFKARWTEDLMKDRVLTASAEIDLKGATVGGHGEFDDGGLSRGGVSVGTGIDAGQKAGPLEVGVSAGGRVGVEFDRTGITDVRIETSVGASAKSGIEDASTGSQVKTEVTGTWSWNGGASASASGGFDRSAF